MSSNNNLIMFGRDRQAVEKLINLKVRDNSGGVLTNKVKDDLIKLRTFHMQFDIGIDNSDGEISRSVREDLINLRTFAMEYDVGIRKGKLPGCFAREFGIEVAPFVMLRDPCQNEFEVDVEKKNGKVYFTHGWASLKNFYDILGGSWDYSICMIKNRNPWSVGSKIVALGIILFV